MAGRQQYLGARVHSVVWRHWVPVRFVVGLTSRLGGGSLVLVPAMVLLRCGNLASLFPSVVSASPANKFATLRPAQAALGSQRRGQRGGACGRRGDAA